MYLIFYSRPGCHLCEDLEEKLRKITNFSLEIDIRNIDTREDWFNVYRYEIPVLFQKINDEERQIPRPSPRITVAELEKLLQDNSI